jgi:hypothetical protein
MRPAVRPAEVLQSEKCEGCLSTGKRVLLSSRATRSVIQPQPMMMEIASVSVEQLAAVFESLDRNPERRQHERPI